MAKKVAADPAAYMDESSDEEDAPPPTSFNITQMPATRAKADPVQKALADYSIIQENPWNKGEM